MWFEIEGYDNRYQINRSGKIRCIATDGLTRILPHHFNAAGYPVVIMRKDGKSKGVLVHRLVATVFIPNPENLPVVNHKNGKKADFRICNLEWCTQRHNVIHAYRMGLNPALGARSKDENAGLSLDDLDLIQSSNLSDAEIAASFDVDIWLIKEVRKPAPEETSRKSGCVCPQSNSAKLSISSGQ